MPQQRSQRDEAVEGGTMAVELERNGLLPMDDVNKSRTAPRVLGFFRKELKSFSMGRTLSL